jgi:hypothetical protein
MEISFETSVFFDYIAKSGKGKGNGEIRSLSFKLSGWQFYGRIYSAFYD